MGKLLFIFYASLVYSFEEVRKESLGSVTIMNSGIPIGQ